MAVPRPYFPGREFVLHPKDIVLLDALLKERFPQVRYYDEPPGHALSQGWGPPRLWLRSTLYGGADRRITMVLDPEWSPQWTVGPLVDGKKDWGLTPPSYPDATIDLGGHVSEVSVTREGSFIYGRKAKLYPGGKLPDHVYPPYISGGAITFRCDKHEPSHMRIAQSALRLIKKIATNRVNVVHYPTLAVVLESEGPGVVWCGHHALEWCRQAPDRFLGYSSRPSGKEGYGYRPPA